MLTTKQYYLQGIDDYHQYYLKDEIEIIVSFLSSRIELQDEQSLDVSFEKLKSRKYDFVQMNLLFSDVRRYCFLENMNLDTINKHINTLLRKQDKITIEEVIEDFVYYLYDTILSNIYNFFKRRGIW